MTVAKDATKTKQKCKNEYHPSDPSCAMQHWRFLSSDYSCVYECKGKKTSRLFYCTMLSQFVALLMLFVDAVADAAINVTTCVTKFVGIWNRKAGW